MSLTNVWVQTWADGLVRADQIVGIDAHPTPALAGKPSRWLVDAILATPIGSGTPERWGVTVLHRTLIQTGQEPREAPLALARLLAQLDRVSAAGVISVNADAPPTPAPGAAGAAGGARRDDGQRGVLTDATEQTAGHAGEQRGGQGGGSIDLAVGDVELPGWPETRTPVSGTGQLRFRFTPFAHPEPGRHTDREYL